MVTMAIVVVTVVMVVVIIVIIVRVEHGLVSSYAKRLGQAAGGRAEASWGKV
jgi:hypothetical protein